MSLQAHAVVWIDHHEARIIFFNRETVDEKIVHPEHAVRHLHSKAGSRDGARAAEDPAFFQDVAAALKDSQSLLVAGPANAKTEFAKYLSLHAPELEKRLAGVEAMERVTDGELLAAARHFFKRADRM
jgi:stalled ribosome rescue protein Dom34